MLCHNNLMFRPLQRFFNIPQHSEMQFKIVVNGFRNIYTAFMPNMNTFLGLKTSS